MIKQFKYILFFLIFISCKTNSDNIKVNSVKINYNILYNGENYFKEALTILKDNYSSNYWDIIPLIEEMEYSRDENIIPTKNFEKAEEKAIKAIQKSKNNQIKILDRAYLLLGKSRFYDQRYIASLQALGQVLERKDEAILWKVMIYLNLDQIDLALKIITDELKTRNKDQINIELLKASVQSEIINKNYKKALVGLKKIYENTDDKIIKSRSSFISAQIYSKNNELDSTKVYYSKTLNSGIKKSSEIYLISKLRLMHINENIDLAEFSKIRRSGLYPEKISLINFYEGLSTLKTDTLKAVSLFNKALKYENIDHFLKLKIYKNLQKISYDQKNYLESSNYIDTLLNIENQSSKEFFKLNALKNKLKSVTKLEEKNIEIDSILILSKLTEKEINDLKTKSNSDTQKKQIKVSNNFNKNTFYYYNQLAIKKGIQDFKMKWGDIKLQDNWKMNLEQNKVISQSAHKNNTNKLIEKTVDYSLTEYEQDSLYNLYNKNMLMLGIYYNEFFNDYVKSLKKLENIDEKYLTNDDKIQLKYYKYLSYLNNKNIKSNQLKKEILENYPSSIYAKRINQQKLVDHQNIDKLKDSIQNLINTNKIELSSRLVDSLIVLNIKRNDLFELKLIKSELILKKDNIKSYVDELTSLKLEFPENKDKLDRMINIVSSVILKKSLDIKDDNFVFGFFIEKKLNNNYGNLNIEYYDEKYDLLVSYGHASLISAKNNLNEFLKKNKKLLNNKYFVFSTSQFINALVFKTLDN